MAPTNALSILLIILTPVSYFPQYQQLLAVHSSAGISISATFLSTLVAQAQVVTMCYLFKSAPEMRYGLPIATPPSTRDWLNLTQILMQWCCSLLYYTLVVIFSTTTPVNNKDNQSMSAVGNKATSKTIPTTLLILHALLFLVSLPVGGRAQDIIFIIIRNINAVVVNPILTAFAVVGFILQAHSTWRAQESDALSKSSLVVQIIVFLLLTILWPFRLILPENMWNSRNQPALLREWYPWVGWACVNNAVVAIGQATVLYVACRRPDGNSLASERQHLLAP